MPMLAALVLAAAAASNADAPLISTNGAERLTLYFEARAECKPAWQRAVYFDGKAEQVACWGVTWMSGNPIVMVLYDDGAADILPASAFRQQRASDAPI